MYPLIRFAKEVLKFRNAPPLAPTGTHISTHMCWPWDIDPWMELNNGRTLTLFDLGRIPMVQRLKLVPTLKRMGWGLTVAGNTTRYRKRIRSFDRFTMLSRLIGWDHRFIYMEQSMWRGGECCNHIMIRSAVTSDRGIVPPDDVVAALGHSIKSPPLPDWVQAWIEADGMRPWPPDIAEDAKGHLPS